jgi:hypothetical protein
VAKPKRIIRKSHHLDQRADAIIAAADAVGGYPSDKGRLVRALRV